jgi:hypothetical protein
MYFSGRISEKSLYDKYLVDFDGVILPYSHYDATVYFYSQVLNFKPLVKKLKDSKKVIGFEISKKRRIYLEPLAEVPDSKGVVLNIRVRNGFDELHSQLVVRSEKPVHRAKRQDYLGLDARGVITQIVERAWGREFVAYDLEGNKVIFTHTKSRSAFRNRKGED